MSIELSGKEISKSIKADLKELIEASGITPVLAAVIFGDDEGSVMYAKSKARTAAKLGIEVEIIHYPDIARTDEALAKIEDIASDPHFHGIILEEPLPDGIDPYPIREAIPPEKDVDCTTVVNLGKIISGDPQFYPATPKAVVEILEHYDIPIEGRHVVIVGRSRTVGLPLANMLLRKGKTGNSTVTVCHSRTQNLADFTKRADILVVAVGRPKFIGREHVTENTVVIDVGTNYVGDKLLGDVDYADLEGYVKAITPVPGGVGPVTVAELLRNVYNSSIILR